MKILNISLLEAISPWLQNHEKILCRVSVQSQYCQLKLHEKLEFKVQNPSQNENIHLLIQYDNIILGSLAFNFEFMFSETLCKVFDDWVKIEVSPENISLISNDPNIDKAPKTLSIKIQASLQEIPGLNRCSSQNSLPEYSACLDGQIKSPNLQSPIISSENAIENDIRKIEDFVSTPEKKIHVGDCYDIKNLKQEDFDDVYIEGKKIRKFSKDDEKYEIWLDDDNDEDLKKNYGEKNQEDEEKWGKKHDGEDFGSAGCVEEIKEPLSTKPPKVKKTDEKMVYSACPYLQNAISSEKHLGKVRKIFDVLKGEMGYFFTKIVEEAKTRESRSSVRSPARRSITSGLTTPAMTQKSINTSIISNFRCDEENTLDVFSTVDLSIEKISIKNIDCLARCICGMMSKKSLVSSQNDEIKATSYTIEELNQAETTFVSSMKATMHEYNKEAEGYDMFIAKTKENNNNLQCLLDSNKKKIELLMHEKEKLSKKLNSIKTEDEKIYKNTSQSSTWTEIRNFAEALGKLDTSKTELDDKLYNMINEYKSYNEKSNEDLEKLTKDKEIMLKELNKIWMDVDEMENDNAKMNKEIQVLGVSNYAENEFEIMYEYFKDQYEDCCMATEKMKKELIRLRMSKDENHTESLFLLQKLERDTNLNQKMQISSQKSSQGHNETISELQKQLKKLKAEISYIEEIYGKKSQIEKNADNLFSRYKNCEANKDVLINEILYFSDFLLSFSQSYLQQKRISQQLKKLVTDKSIEIDALRDAVNEIKEKNPVYAPVEGDYIDEALGNYLNSRDIELLVPFKRVSYGLYYFGSKKVMISYERNKLIAKSGGGFISLENFIETFTTGEMEKREKALESPKNKGKVKETCDFNIGKELLEQEIRAETPIIEEDI